MASLAGREFETFDLVLISELAGLDAAILRRAIQETFTARGTHPVPDALPPSPLEWSIPFGELARTDGKRRQRGSIRRRGNSLQVLVYAGLDPLTGDRIYLSESTTDEAEAKRILTR